MNPGRTLICVGPDDLLVSCHFEQLRLAWLRMIGGNHRVAIWQSLCAAGIIEWFTGEIVIGELPDGLAVLVDFNCCVANRAVDQGVAVVETNGGEGPVGSGDFPDNLSIRLIFADKFKTTLTGFGQPRKTSWW